MKEKRSVPENHSGVETNTESERIFESNASALAFYKQVRERLLNPNCWHQYAGKTTADFQLTDEKGNEIERMVQKGDHFRIDIPGPGSDTGNGYDWVRVETIDEENEGEERFTALRVRPASNPLNDNEDVAHFFKDDATSSFIVCLQGNKIKTGVYGRNEKPNTDANKIIDKARNAAVATGAISGFAKLQWKSLVEGLLGGE